VENAMTRLRKNEKGMILAIDMGNTNIVIGCVDDNGVLFEERLSTDFSKTELEYAIGFKTVLELYNIDSYDIKGAIMSSVVPQLSNIIKSAVEKTIGISPLIVGPGIKTGLNILMDQPRQVGSDQIVDAVAALKVYGAPSIIIDMGTATTMSVVDENENYIGGVILPGIRVSVDSLVSRTAQLPRIALDAPKSVMGKNTIDCMKSGVVYGNASCIDGMIDRMIEANGFNKNGTKAVTIVATGGLSEVIIPHCRHDIKVDPGLLLKGLSIIYDKNVE
jgi:type III pantothenate kinase